MMDFTYTYPSFTASVVSQNICPGGSAYFRIIPTSASAPCKLLLKMIFHLKF